MNCGGAVAAVDCGTNSTRLLVANAGGASLVREMRITRLGAGVDANGRLARDAIERTLVALKEFRSLMDAEAVERARLVATSAVRDAANGFEFLGAASEVIGFEAELLHGQEEGRLSYDGATAEMAETRSNFVVLDIGGGSTELVARPFDEIVAVSMDIGCVRLTERFLHGNPPLRSEVDHAVDAIHLALDEAERVIPQLGRVSGARLVGLAGTVSTFATLELGIDEYDRNAVHHFELALDTVVKWCRLLGSETLEDRAQRAGLPAGRRDVIFGGGLVLREVMQRFRFQTCIVSESDILDGLVTSMLPVQRRSDSSPEADIVDRS
jgi:exopolyphosphatase/guanosine-5'-triphosphate,3'-diphosphate pyrophosphatase